MVRTDIFIPTINIGTNASPSARQTELQAQTIIIHLCISLTQKKKCECSECQFCAIFVYKIPFCALAKQFLSLQIRDTNLFIQSFVPDSVERTRPGTASFANSVVFPGGISEPFDGSHRWLNLLASFGYSKQDFAAFHHPGGVITPIFQKDPIQRHIQLRITAIRETFEELGLLICSRQHKEERDGQWAGVIEDVDVNYWKDRLTKNPEDWLALCEEHKCYPDIFSLNYWSNWLTPAKAKRRFNTAFFVTALEKKPTIFKSSSEVVDIEWLSPDEVLNSDKLLFPPQFYELKRLSHVTDITQLIQFARQRSGHADQLSFPVILRAKDGYLHLLPGDDLYPTSVDYNDNTIELIDKTILELREGCQTLNRLEAYKETKQFIIQNCKPEHHINMEDQIIPAVITV